MPVLTDEDVGLASPVLSDEDVGLAPAKTVLSDADVGIKPKSEKYLAMQAERDALARADAGSTTANILEHVEGVVSKIANPVGAILELPEQAMRVTGLDMPYTVKAPLVTPEAAKAAVEFITPGGKGSEGSVTKAVQEFVAENISPMTSPEMVGLVAAGTKTPVPVGRYFQGQMLTHVPASVAALNEAEGSDATKAALGVVANVAFPALIEKGISPAKQILIERAKEVGPATEQALKETVKEPTPAGKAPEPSVPPATATGETVKPAEVAQPTPAEPSLPISTPKVEITQPDVSGPSIHETAALRAKIADNDAPKYRPAIRLNDTGDIIAGTNHENALKIWEELPSTRRAAGFDRGFLSEEGDFLNLLEVARREQAKAKTPTKAAGKGKTELAGESSMHAGPGAASPVEFEQRVRSLENPPPNKPPAATIDAKLEPNVEVVRKAKDYNIFNRVNSPQAVFGSGNLGPSAKAAWEKMALGEFAMREGIARDVDTFVNNLSSSLPKQLRKDGGKAFFEILDGKGIEQIEAEFAGQPQVTTAARALKQRLEEIRASIRDTKRQQYETYLNGLDREVIADIYRNTINEAVPQSKSQAAQALSMTAYPDDWGIADGSYLPHLFFGSWKVTMRRPGADADSFVTRAKTPEEAKAFIRQTVKNDPELGAARFNVEQDVVIPADMVRLFDAKFFKLVSEMKERTGLTAGEVREAQQGIIGRKAAKKKWWGSLQERQGFAGYEKDFGRVMSAYLNGYHRWRVLSQLQNEVTPLIESVKQEGRPNAAVRLESLMDNLWGKPAESSLQFDALVQRVPGMRDWVQPLALDRWTRFVRSVAAVGHLTTLRFSVINRLQPLQGLYPIVGERLMLQAKRLQHTTEGRKLLDQYGVTFDTGQFSEVGVRSKAAALREKLSGERSNQEMGFLAMYLHGQERGLPPAEAAKYAKLRGQLMTQFHPLTVDIPQAFEGPVAQTVFQYRRFSVKQLELIGGMAKSKNLTGISRMLSVLALTGGLSYFLRQTYSSGDDKLRIRKNLEDALGKDGADLVFYGLPGMVNADLSGSLVLGDQPRGNIYETIGRATVGPAVSTGIDLAKTVTTESREDISDWKKALVAMRRIPALKPLAEGIALLEGDKDVLSPDGETRYRRSVKDTLVGMGAFRSANEATLQTTIEGIIELKKETARLKNRYYVDWQKGDMEAVLQDIASFNDRWPEAAITQSELTDYTRRRRSGSAKTDQERIQGKRFQQLAPQP